MEKRKLLGSLTIIAAIPFLGFIIFFFSVYNINWFLIENIAIVIFCSVGGKLLWRSSKWGYRLSAIGWAILLFDSVTSVFAVLLTEITTQARTILITKDIIYLLIGIPADFILIRDMMKERKV